MKYVGKTKSGAGATVYDIRVGANELLTILHLLIAAHKSTPRTFETASFKQRTKNMRTCLSAIVRDEKIKTPTVAFEDLDV